MGGEGPDGSRNKVSPNKKKCFSPNYSLATNKTRANLKLVIIGTTLGDAVKDWGGGGKGAPHPEEKDTEPLLLAGCPKCG